MTGCQCQRNTLGTAHVSSKLHNESDYSWRLENDSALLDYGELQFPESATDVNSNMTINHKEQSLIKNWVKIIEHFANCCTALRLTKVSYLAYIMCPMKNLEATSCHHYK